MEMWLLQDKAVCVRRGAQGIAMNSKRFQTRTYWRLRIAGHGLAYLSRPDTLRHKMFFLTLAFFDPGGAMYYRWWEQRDSSVEPMTLLRPDENYKGTDERAPQVSEPLTIWRDSVCMGDDADAPHELKLPTNELESIRSVLKRLLDSGYLAQIGGGKATWIFQANSRPLAVVAQQWPHPRFVVSPYQRAAAFRLGAAPNFDFLYWCQADPETVWECLRAGKPLPDRYSGSPAA